MNNVIVKTGGDGGNDDDVGLSNRIVCKNNELGGFNLSIRFRSNGQLSIILYFNLSAQLAALLLEDFAFRYSVQPVILGNSPSVLVSTVADDFIFLGESKTVVKYIGRLNYPITMYPN